jgi:hypothetical protein
MPKTRFAGVGKSGEPTFERSLASDSLLLYLGARPKTPKEAVEEVPDNYAQALGMKTAHMHEIRQRALSPSNPEGSYLDDWTVEPDATTPHDERVPMVSVLVPPDHESGMLARVPDPDTGDFIEFIVPDGKEPGDVVLVPRVLK